MNTVVLLTASGRCGGANGGGHDTGTAATSSPDTKCVCTAVTGAALGIPVVDGRLGLAFRVEERLARRNCQLQFRGVRPVYPLWGRKVSGCSVMLRLELRFESSFELGLEEDPGFRNGLETWPADMLECFAAWCREGLGIQRWLPPWWLAENGCVALKGGA